MDLGLKQAIELMVVILLVALLLVMTGNLARKDSKQGKTEHSNLWSGAKAVIPSKPQAIYEKAEEYDVKSENYGKAGGLAMGTEPQDRTLLSHTLQTPYNKGNRYIVSFEAKSYATAKHITAQFGEVEDKTPWSLKSKEEEERLEKIYNKQVLSRIDDSAFDRVNQKTFNISDTWQPYSFTIEIGNADGGQTDFKKEMKLTYRESLQKTDKVGIRNVKITKIK